MLNALILFLPVTDGSSQVPSWGDGPPLGPAVLTLLSRSAAFVLQEPTINLPVISYKLTCTPREEFFYANNATALSSSIRVFVEGLHPGVRYECTFRARNSAGNSVPSQTTSIKIADACKYHILHKLSQFVPVTFVPVTFVPHICTRDIGIKWIRSEREWDRTWEKCYGVGGRERERERERER